MKLSDFKKGFRYMAFVGYGWIEVECYKTGFSKEQLPLALEKKIAKPLPNKSNSK